MFDTEISVDSLEQALLDSERVIAVHRSRQLGVLRRLEEAQVTARDGSRSMQEWVTARLGVERNTAKDLVRLARNMAQESETASALKKGRISSDRAKAEGRLAEAGASDEVVTDSRSRDVAGIWKLVSRHRHLSRCDEQQAFADRYFVLQPSLDESSWRLSGQLAGVDGRVVEKALDQRRDELPRDPDARGSASQRNADALTSICQDSLTGVSQDGTDRSEPLVTVFVDASLATGTGGEAGVELETGPKIGPEALSELLCNGRVDFVGIRDGKPLTLGDSQAVVPPRLRRYILWRDGGCVIDGCGSRYRLQIHHLMPRHLGGTNDQTNLATLCWYHHHVAIHGQGYRVDPDSPAHRRRLISSAATRAPPSG
ncbi:MAG: DUF222 domain-containing protein [Acidimicrobiia bacterium]